MGKTNYSPFSPYNYDEEYEFEVNRDLEDLEDKVDKIPTSVTDTYSKEYVDS